MPPPCHDDATLAEVDAYNAEVTAIYETLMPVCEDCGRRFKDEGRLAKHSKGCKAGHFKPLPSRGHSPASSPSGGAIKNISSPKLAGNVSKPTRRRGSSVNLAN